MRLSTVSRPFVSFDPTNKQHRRDFAEFMRTGSWSNCAVRYVDEDDRGNLAACLQRRMAEYYIEKEFKISQQTG